MGNKQKYLLLVGIVLLCVGIDQWLKWYVHSHFALGESVSITSWFWICYVENNGMAFGIEWFSKVFLTLFRIVAVIFLSWYAHKLIKHNFRTGYLVSIALTLAGALGNIIDCVFYGVIYDYAPLLYGKVIDMFYFPLITNRAGEVIFFRPVFNFADSCITVSVFVIFLFFRKDFDLSLHKFHEDI